MSYHNLILVGNLGRDPEMRYTAQGTPVTNFNLATNRRYTDSDGNPAKETTWFRVSVFGKQAEACAQYLKKGSQALVEGRLTADPQTGGPKVFERNDGTAGAAFEVIANTVRFLDRKGETPGDNGVTVPAGAESEDDIPF
jgi:single-strand DNA-binding protein